MLYLFSKNITHYIRSMGIPRSSHESESILYLNCSALKINADVFVCSEKLHCQSANNSAYVTAYNTGIMTGTF